MALRIDISDAGVITITPSTPPQNDVQLALNAILSTLSVNGQQLEQLKMNDQELAAELRGVTVQLTQTNTRLDKVGGETAATLQKVADLEALIAAAGNSVTQEVLDALADLKVQAARANTTATAIDDQVADPPAP